MIELIPFPTLCDRFYISNNNVVVGMIDYYIDDDEIFIDYLKIYDEFQRSGYGRKAIMYLLEKHPDKYIRGKSLRDSVGFWYKLGAEFDIKPNYINLTIPFIIRQLGDGINE